jgi:hypothetical protein
VGERLDGLVSEDGWVSVHLSGRVDTMVDEESGKKR